MKGWFHCFVCLLLALTSCSAQGSQPLPQHSFFQNKHKHTNNNRHHKKKKKVLDTYLIGELESLNQTDDLVNVTANGQIVNGDLTNDLLGVDDEQTTVSNSLILLQDTVIGGNLLGEVSNDGDLHLSQTTLVAGGVDPGEVRELRVAGAGEDGGLEAREALDSLGEGNDLSGADKAIVGCN